MLPLPLEPPTPIPAMEVAKRMYLEGVPQKDICRVTGYAPRTMAYRFKEWSLEKAKLAHSVWARYGESLERQTQELVGFQGRVLDRASQLEAKVGTLKSLSAQARVLGQLQAILTQGVQSMRLVTGGSTAKTEHTLSAMIVHAQAELDAARRGEGRGREGRERESPTSSPSLPAASRAS